MQPYSTRLPLVVALLFGAAQLLIGYVWIRISAVVPSQAFPLPPVLPLAPVPQLVWTVIDVLLAALLGYVLTYQVRSRSQDAQSAFLVRALCAFCYAASVSLAIRLMSWLWQTNLQALVALTTVCAFAIAFTVSSLLTTTHLVQLQTAHDPSSKRKARLLGAAAGITYSFGGLAALALSLLYVLLQRMLPRESTSQKA